MPRRVLLLRHTHVAARWRGTCYGRLDVGLGVDGRDAARRLADALPIECFDRIISSPSRRSRWLGGLLARRGGTDLAIDARLAERDFGAWEGVPWDTIWRGEGDSMDGMIDAPDGFRPGGGETTAELAARAVAWLRGLPARSAVLAVTHGGPIGALAGALLGEAPRAWLARVPRPGEGVLLTFHQSGRPGAGAWPQVRP